MLDADWQHDELIDQCLSIGAKILVYQEGAISLPFEGEIHAGKMRPHSATSAYLVQSPGYAEILRRLGDIDPAKVIDIGWWYCPLAPFRPRSAIKRLVFALPHDDPEDLARNRAIFEDCYRLCPDGLRVRMLANRGGCEENGIRHVPGVEYVKVSPNLDWDDIDAADLVVATGTYAYLAVARGVPTIFIDPVGTPDHDERGNQLERWGLFAEYARFPVAYGDYAFFNLTVHRALTVEPVEWKRRFMPTGLSLLKFLEAL